MRLVAVSSTVCSLPMLASSPIGLPHSSSVVGGPDSAP